ncbi:MAG: hypothetical protein QM658_15875 [Gordonia sp. (in: high G+C Gram-positive bacteria)]
MSHLSRASARSAILLLIAMLAGALTAALAPDASATPRTSAAELDFAKYQAVDAHRFQSLRYDDNGRVFFVAGQWRCQLGAQPGSVACKGRPATAPPNTVGVSIVGDQQGPWWVAPGTTFRFGSVTGFRAPVLKVGQRITFANTTCAVPRRNVVACASTNRAFILSRGWHKFYFPRYDRAHSKNPAPKYLPPRLR